MIQIDDAGSGSLIGGTIIGVYRVETHEYLDDIIPLRLYSQKGMTTKEYLHYVVYLVQKIFDTLEVSKDEPIQVCRGYMFDELRKWLKQQNYTWHSTIIEGTLQDQIERSFECYAISLGFPEAFINYTKYPFHFHRILKWVYADYENRKKLCKIGWKSFEKYGTLPIEEKLETKTSKKVVYCLKCGKKIDMGKTFKIRSFYSNRYNEIYLHENC